MCANMALVSGRSSGLDMLKNALVLGILLVLIVPAVPILSSHTGTQVAAPPLLSGTKLLTPSNSNLSLLKSIRTDQSAPVEPNGVRAKQFGWVNLTSIVGIVPTGGGSLVYDAKDGYVLDYSGPNQTYAFEGGKWIHMVTTSNPTSQNDGQGLAYDPVSHEVVMYGGTNSACGAPCSNNQTWVYSAGKWTQLQTPSTMPAATVAAMDWDATDNYVVAFLGYCTTNTANCPSTWAFANGTWTQITTATQPPARCGSANFYDVNEGKVILFGGGNCFTGPQGDTWNYSAAAWRQETPNTSPPARAGTPSGAYDPNGGYALMFGGSVSGGGGNHTWKYVHGNWTDVTAIAGTPPIATGQPYAMAYNPGTATIMLVDSIGDTWSWGTPATFYNATFSESGLPKGEVWAVSLYGNMFSAIAPMNITIPVENGTYHFVFSSPSNSTIWYSPSPSTVDVNVVGKNISVAVKFSIAALAVRVFNIGGQWASNLTGGTSAVLYYASNYTRGNLPKEWVVWDGIAEWEGIPSGKYVMEIYHYPGVGLNETEFWGDDTYTVTSSSTTSYENFTRWTPWIRDVTFGNTTLATNQTDSAFVQIDYPSSTGWNITASVDLYLTNNVTTNPYQHWYVSPKMIVAPGHSYNFSFPFDLSASGTYYYYVDTFSEFGGGPDFTDQYNWTKAVVVTNHPSFPVQVNATGIAYGVPWAAYLNGAVLNSTGNKTFYEPTGNYSLGVTTVTVPSGEEFVPSHVLTNISVNRSAQVNLSFQVEYLLWTSTLGLGLISPSSTYYLPGTFVNMSETPEYGSTFVRWVGSGSGNYSGNKSNYTVIMNNPIVEEAMFQGGAQTWRNDKNFTITPIIDETSFTLGWGWVSLNIPIPFGVYLITPGTTATSGAYNYSLSKWFNLSEGKFTGADLVLFQIEGVRQLVQEVNGIYNASTFGLASVNMMSSLGTLFDAQGNVTFYSLFTWSFSNTSLTTFVKDVELYFLSVIEGQLKGNSGLDISQLINTIFDIFDVNIGVMATTAVGHSQGFSPIIDLNIGTIVQADSTIIGFLVGIGETIADCMAFETGYALYPCLMGIGQLVLSGIDWVASAIKAPSWIVFGLNWITAVVDPAGTTAAPSLVNNGSTVLGFANTSSNILWGSAAGFVLEGSGIWEVHLNNASYNDTLVIQQVGNPSIPIPYLTTVGGFEGGDFAVGSGAVYDGKSAESTIMVSPGAQTVNVSWFAVAQFRNVTWYATTSQDIVHGALFYGQTVITTGTIFVFQNGSIVAQSQIEKGLFNFTLPYTGHNETVVLESWANSHIGESYLLTLAPTLLTMLSFTATPKTVSVGQTTSLNVSVNGGTPPYTYTYVGLPIGCASSDSAILECAPTTAGNYNVRVYVNDSARHSITATTSLAVTNKAGPAPSPFLSRSTLLVIVLAVVVAVIVIVVLLVRNRKKKGETGSDTLPTKNLPAKSKGKESPQDAEKPASEKQSGSTDGEAKPKA